MGLILAVLVHAANIQDRDGARQLLEKVKGCLPGLKLIWADAAYGGQFEHWAKETCNWVIEIVRKPQNGKGFQVLPRRWVVERTFAWLGRYRRLSKDYEYSTDTSQAMIYLAMIHLMTRRLARMSNPSSP